MEIFLVRAVNQRPLTVQVSILPTSGVLTVHQTLNFNTVLAEDRLYNASFSIPSSILVTLKEERNKGDFGLLFK